MSYLLNRDFLIEVQKGNITGHSMVHKFGRGDAANGSWSFVNLLASSVGLMAAASTVRIKAGGNAADAAGGVGATSVTVQGILATTFLEDTEVIVTAGASASSNTSNSFWRVHRAWVSAVGAYGVANTADIVIEKSAGSADLIKIAIDEGQTQYGGFTIPAGKTGYLLSVHATVDTNKTANIRMFTRAEIDTVSAPMQAKRLKLFWDGVQSPGFVYKPYGPELMLAEKTDIWFEAYGDGASSTVTVDFEILLVDN